MCPRRARDPPEDSRGGSPGKTPDAGPTADQRPYANSRPASSAGDGPGMGARPPAGGVSAGGPAWRGWVFPLSGAPRGISDGAPTPQATPIEASGGSTSYPPGPAS